MDNTKTSRISAKMIIIGCVVLCIALALGLVWLFRAYDDYLALQEERSPEIEASCDEDHFLEVLDAYDPDGYFLVKTGLDNGDDITQYYEDVNLAVDVLGTIVHEECHEYSRMDDENDERLYMGDGDSIVVSHTEIYPTVEMAATIPEECKSFRYENYIGSPSDILATNVDGIYGLLNEFCAYTWGTNNDICLYDYYDKEGPDNQYTWGIWLSLACGNKLAYAEFKYYILHYLLYAQENYPAVYDGIMANDNFREAYRILEGKYAEIAKKQDEYTAQIIKKLDTPFSKVEYEPNVQLRVTNIISKASDVTSLSSGEYETLLKEIAKPEHQQIHDALVAQ